MLLKVSRKLLIPLQIATEALPSCLEALHAIISLCNYCV